MNDAPRSLSPQAQLLLDYMGQGRSLTNLIALTVLGVGSVSTRIAELRALGYDIKSEPCEDHRGKRYVKYSLAAASGETP